MYTHQGMNTYNRILQDARANGDPIGPKHHEFNRHLKQWEAKNKNRTQLAKAREAKKVKGELRKARTSINKAMEKIAAKQNEISQEAQLREKYAQLQREKIAAGYKVEDRNPGVKSRGNGL